MYIFAALPRSSLVAKSACTNDQSNGVHQARREVKRLMHTVGRHLVTAVKTFKQTFEVRNAVRRRLS
jgi:hypothetical protein